MVSLCAAVAAAVAAYQWRRASATRRVVPQGPSALALLGRSAYGLFTRRRTVRRRGRETVALERALAAELRAGAPEATAFAAATSVASVSGGSLGPWLVSATAAVMRGGSLPTELRRVAEVRGAERLLPVAAAWAVASRYGAPMTGVLDRLADAYDDEDAVRADLAASVAGSQASMLLLAALPLAGLALGAAIGARPWAWLFGRPVGWLVCLAAALLDGAGLVWTRWLLRSRS